ncbi:MAG: glutamate--tRNA ligase [Aestuariivita sp.]|nr:glutamate--tRNA ligase [Aestuariivita sp.]MCY4201348.1 glutamate--tRNA ligase [Aestuariivita sp.]
MTITRFAPSPTGHLHVGNLRTALMNFLIARKVTGQFILRLDDTDRERSKTAFSDSIREDLNWLGLHWDRLERQSDRLERYLKAADQLRAMGRLYEAFETPSELELKRKKQRNMGRPPVYDRAALSLTEAEKTALRSERGNGVWRFKLDHERVTWIDGILGEVSIDTASLSDPVLIRRDGQFLYTLASVVDDIEMEITDVVRGSDHVTNTAIQCQIIRALGGSVPRFAHHSLLTGPKGEPFAKRVGANALRVLRQTGIEPMALLSLLARLGTSDPVVVYQNLTEVVDAFDISRFGASATKFDEQLLFPLSGKYLQTLTFEAVAAEIKYLGVPESLAEKFWLTTRDNISTKQDLATWWLIFRDGADPEIAEEDREFVNVALEILPERPFDENTWANWTRDVKEKTDRRGRGLFMPLRKALTGQSSGPDMGAVMPLLQVIKAKAL